jgi:general secretion pathway protein C
VAAASGLRERVPLLACGLVSLVLAATAWSPVHRAFGHSPEPSAPTARSPATPDILHELAAAALFGTAAARLEPVAAGEEALLLVGTIARAGRPADGLAIIGPTAPRAIAYTVGQPLPGDYTLSAVFEDRVVVTRNGGERTLYLPRTDLGALLAALGRSSGTVDAPEPPPDLEREAAVQRDPLFQMAAGEWTFGGLNPKPRLVGGRVVGALLTPEGGDATALARRADLRPGDVLTAIDGQPLAAVAGLPAQLRALEGRQAQLTVQRRSGETSVIVVSLPKLDHDDT